MSEENIVIAPPPEEKTLNTNLEELPDQSEQILPIDMSIVSEFCKEIENASTTKRLVNIPDCADKFKQAFLNLERFQEFTQVYEDLMSIFNKMRSDCEFDYFDFKMKEIIEEETADEPNGD